LIWDMDSRDEILQKIRSVRIDENPDTSYFQEDIYQPVEDLLSCFKTELETIAAQLVLVDDEQDFILKFMKILKEREISSVYTEDEVICHLLEDAGIHVENSEVFPEEMRCGITGCEFLIARTGSILISTSAVSGRRAHVFPPVHIVLANENQLVRYPQDAILALKEKYGDNLPSQISTITGPSRTADIEKTLVMGAHGPKELIIFVKRNNQVNQLP